MIRITLTLTGALAALAFSAATAHADLDAPTPIGDGFNVNDACCAGSSFDYNELYYQDFSVPNAPAETFEGAVQSDSNVFGGAEDENVVVEQDISGNVPVGEQWNEFHIDNFGGIFSGFGEVYNNIGGTPEAFYITPFGDLNVPTWFVEAVGPTFFEPSQFAAALPAAELPGLTADLSSLLAGLL
jgi:hypothetical protein